MAIQAPPQLSSTQDDVWVPTVCVTCFSCCHVLAHRVNGVVMKIEGNPESPHNGEKVCAKGNAAMMSLYDPNRLTTPVKRTNPEKGVGVDPQWVEISWDEALNTVADRLKKIRKDNPKKLMATTFDESATFTLRAWCAAFGTPHHSWVGYFCGNALHPIMYTTNGSFHSDFDIDQCNYLILMGNQMGFQVGLNPNIVTQKMADARARGMKLVVVDPVCSIAAAKADEWVPIRPGTDGALSLGMVNVLLNELGIYDREFIGRHTNGCYLTGQDGFFVRDVATKKPLIWDAAGGKPKPFDSDIKEPAIEGTYEVEGAVVRPAFDRLKEHVKKYTPESVSQITTIPAEVIRRLAKEYGEAARIGSKIMIEGQELPYRPVAVNQYKGSNAHKHGTLAGISVQLLNILVGGMYMVGSHRGVNIIGPQRSWEPQLSPDGLIQPARPIGLVHAGEIKRPETLGLPELFPFSTNISPMVHYSANYPEQFKLPFKPEMLILARKNLIMTGANIQASEEVLKKIPFIVNFACQLDEVSEFADIVFPDAHVLERLDLFPNKYHLAVSPSTGYWYWAARIPVVPPPGTAKYWVEALFDLAERAGFLGDFYEMLNLEYNEVWAIKGQGFHLDRNKKYTWEEICDLQAKAMFGPEHGMDWFRKYGVLKAKRTVEETYPGPGLKARFPIYFDHYVRAAQGIKKVTGEMGIDWDISDYQFLPDWKPCPAYEDNEQKASAYDLFAINYKIPIHAHSFTMSNPWLAELGEHESRAYKLVMNAETAKKKGLKDGDTVWVESEAGKQKGKLKVTECIHPEVVGIAGAFGSWAKGKPIAQGKGLHYNALVPMNLKRMDFVSTVLDSCLRVKVWKVKE